MGCYEQALAADPQQIAAYWGKAILLENQGLYQEAIAAYDPVIKLDPKRADVWESRGRCLIYLPERMQEALESYNNAITLDPNSVSAHTDRGWVLIELRRYTEAIEDCETAIRLEREAPVPRANKSFALMELGRLGECEQFLKDGIQIVREPKLLLENLSLLYSDYTLEEQKGLEIERELLNSDPSRRTSYAEYLLRLGDYSEARDNARTVEQTETRG